MTDCPLRFDVPGWIAEPATAGTPASWRWHDDVGNSLAVSIVDEPRAGPGRDVSLTEMRNSLRARAAAAGAGIVEVEHTTVDGVTALRVITKAPAGLGFTYTGRVLVPATGPRYELVVEAGEHGTTGSREAVATAALAKSGELAWTPPPAPGQPSPIVGWLADPYDPAFDATALNCVADDERLDAILAAHPLSRVRRVLQAVSSTATLTRRNELPARIGTPMPASTPRRGRLSSKAVDGIASRVEGGGAGASHEVLDYGSDATEPDATRARQLTLVGVAVAAVACIGFTLAAMSDAAVLAAATAVLLAGIRLRLNPEGTLARYAGTTLVLMSAFGIIRYIMRLLNGAE